MKKSIVRKPVLAPRLSIGLDLGSEASVACVLDHQGAVAARTVVRMTPAGVRASFRRVPAAVVLLESCSFSAWVARLLGELGHEVITCNPRRLKLIAGSTLKTDALDAENLARLARLHQLDPELLHQSVVRSQETQLRRDVLTIRDQLVATRTRFVSALRNILRAHAVPLPRCASEVFVARLRQHVLPAKVAAVVEPLLPAIDAINRQITVVEKQIREFAKQMPVIRRLVEIDGVGLMTAVSFALTVEDPARFPHARDVGPYLGLIPKLRQSSQSERRGGCTKQGDQRTRRCLVQAALGLLRTRRESALRKWALGLVERRGKKKAVVAISRKLAVLMQHLWLTDEHYQPFPGKVGDAAA